MTSSELNLISYREARGQVRDGDLLLFRRRGFISIAGRGEHSHAAKAIWWGDDLCNWRPRRWNDAPLQATAVELIEDTSFTEEEARLFLEGFNSQMLQHNRPLWAVAVPIVVRYEGDSRPGQTIRGYVFDERSA